jgi:predicted Zn-dependent protease
MVSVVVLWLVGCSAPPNPDVALRQAESRLRANDAAEAERILRDALPETPRDPRLRIVLARAELALGNATGAEGSLRRAMDLGSSKEEVATYLAQAMFAQGAPQRAIEFIGDLQQWPQERRLALATVKGEISRCPTTTSVI